jgi:excisionase family DNA binding protein
MIYFSTNGRYGIQLCATLNESKTMKKECSLCGRELDQNNPNSVCFSCVQKLTDSVALPYCYNVEEVRKILRLESQEQVRRMIRKGELPAVRRGKRYLFPKDDFDAWLKSGQPTTDREEGSEAEKKGITKDVTANNLPLESITSKTYQETEHKQKMRELARKLREAIALPWIMDSFILNFKPGPLLLGSESLPIDIGKDGVIHIQSSLENNTRPIYLWHSLRSHLQTGGFADVLDTIGSWKEGVGNNLSECYNLLQFLRRKLQKTFNTTIPEDDKGEQHGFTIFFPITVLADGIEQIQWSTSLPEFQYRLDASGLRFGAWLIYQGREDEDLKFYEDAHRKLRSECTKWEQTIKIGQQRRDLYHMATEIKERLGQFVDTERLPGTCELCSPSHP